MLDSPPECSVKPLFILGSEITSDNAAMVFAPCLLLPQRLLRPVFAAVVVCLCALAGPLLYASDRDDHDRARQAVQAGQVLPLPAVLERLQREVPGQVLEVELEQKRGVWIYEFKLLTPDGQISKVVLDAQTAQVLRIQPRDDKTPHRDERGRR